MAGHSTSSTRSAPPLGRYVVLALLLHLAILLALLWGWHSPYLRAEDDAAPATVGLWDAADLEAMAPAQKSRPPKPVVRATPVPPKPQPTLPPEPDPIAEDEPPADIHLGRDTKKKPSRTPIPTVKPTAKPEPTAKPKPTAKPEPTAKPTTKPTAKPQATTKPQPTAKATAKSSTVAGRASSAADDDDPLAALAAQSGGRRGGSTTSRHDGQGKGAYQPSNSYLARVGAVIKRHTTFDAFDVVGNPSVEIEIQLSADGRVQGKPRIVRPSGNPDWDAAAVAGIERAAQLPIDPDLGRAPPEMRITRRPKD